MLNGNRGPNVNGISWIPKTLSFSIHAHLKDEVVGSKLLKITKIQQSHPCRDRRGVPRLFPENFSKFSPFYSRHREGHKICWKDGHGWNELNLI